MTQIGNVQEINSVKQQLDALKKKGFILAWEVPYENLLTRLDAAIFFLSPSANIAVEEIWQSLMQEGMSYRPNDDKKLSMLEWRVEFKR